MESHMTYKGVDYLLNPCPVCGFEMARPEGDKVTMEAHVECVSCGFKGPFSKDPGAAAVGWNSLGIRGFKVHMARAVAILRETGDLPPAQAA